MGREEQDNVISTLLRILSQLLLNVLGKGLNET